MRKLHLRIALVILAVVVAVLVYVVYLTLPVAEADTIDSCSQGCVGPPDDCIEWLGCRLQDMNTPCQCYSPLDGGCRLYIQTVCTYDTPKCPTGWDCWSGFWISLFRVYLPIIAADSL